MIPQNDISITPIKIKKFINDLFDREIKHYDYNTEYKKLLANVKDIFISELSKTFLWQKDLLSYRNCDHIFTDNSKLHGTICGRRINIITDGDNYQCSVHIKKSKYKPNKRNVDDSLRCPGINMKGDRCGLRKKKEYNGYCVFHYKDNKIFSLENEIIKEKKINLNNYIKDMIYYNMNMDFIYDYIERNKKDNIIIDPDPLYENDINILNESNCYTIKKFKNIKSSIDVLNKEKQDICVINPNICDVNKYLNNNIKIYNNKEFLRDISTYDIYNGKKINTTKLINYYKKIEKIKLYIENNKKYIHLKGLNKNREWYIKEKYVNILLEYINMRYNDLYDTLQDFDPGSWFSLLSDYKNDVDGIILEFYDLNDDEKIYI